MKLDFSHILFIGKQIGYQEKEIGRMYYGKWAALFEQYKKQWNMRQKHIIYTEKEKEQSALDL